MEHQNNSDNQQSQTKTIPNQKVYCPWASKSPFAASTGTGTTTYTTNLSSCTGIAHENVPSIYMGPSFSNEVNNTYKFV